MEIIKLGNIRLLAVLVLNVLVDHCHAVKTVGVSGKSLPEGLIQHGNPYESWSSYKERVNEDIAKRTARQKRDVNILSRQKRSLGFPTGSTIGFAPELFIPVFSAGDLGVNFDSVLSFTYNLPNGTVSLGRSLGGDRAAIYRMARAGMDRMGLDGNTCLLRAICEAAEYPIENEGLLGEILDIILTTSRATVSGDELSEHLKAEHQGRSGANCHATYSSCPVSLFNISV